MSTYIVTRKSDGVEVYRYGGADAPIEWVGFEFATHDHAPVADPPPPPPPPDPEPVRITKLAFRQRFTGAERATVTYAAKQATAQGAAIQSYLDDVQAATYIDLTRTDTRAGVLALEAGGILAVGRSAAILDTPAEDHEVWHG